MTIPQRHLDFLVVQVLDNKLDASALSDSELLAVSHVFLDEDCVLPPTDAVFAEISARGLEGCK